MLTLDYVGNKTGLMGFLKDVENCKHCHGRGICYVSDGRDDVSPEICEHRQKSLIEVLTDAINTKPQDFLGK